MIDDLDFFPVKAKSKYKCYTNGCKNKSKDMQFYLTEWTLKAGNSTAGIFYCEECILKAFPNLKVT